MSIRKTFYGVADDFFKGMRLGFSPGYRSIVSPPSVTKHWAPNKVIDRFLDAMKCADNKREEKYIWKAYTNELIKLGMSREDAKKELKYWWDVYTFKTD